MDASEAVSLLLNRFPVVRQLVGSADDLNLAPPFYAYERFAGEIHHRVNDETFMISVGEFINELADTNDPLLENVLWVTILEKIAEDPLVSTRTKGYLGLKAKEMLEEVEREFYGRK